jgi:hypothetical protein
MAVNERVILEPSTQSLKIKRKSVNNNTQTATKKLGASSSGVPVERKLDEMDAEALSTVSCLRKTTTKNKKTNSPKRQV